MPIRVLVPILEVLGIITIAVAVGILFTFGWGLLAIGVGTLLYGVALDLELP